MKISILVPVYNQKYLHDLYESILDQSYENWELIFVNDGSPDDSLNILNEFAASNSKVKVIDQVNLGAAKALNNGLDYVTGEYVLLMGHDDLISPDLLKNALEKMSGNLPDVIIPNVLIDFTNANGGWEWNKTMDVDITEELDGVTAFVRTFPWRIHGWALWKRELIVKFKCPTFNRFNPDEYMCRELMLNSNKIVFCNGFYKYRFNDDSISRKISLKMFEIHITDKKLYDLALTFPIPQNCLELILRTAFNNIMMSQKRLFFNVGSFSKEEKIQAQMFTLNAYNEFLKIKDQYKDSFFKKMLLTNGYNIFRSVIFVHTIFLKLTN